MEVRQIKFPSWHVKLDEPKARYIVLKGGRGSAKSETVARKLLLKGASSKRRILCCREFQKSIRESVHATLVAAYQEMGLEHVYHHTERTLVGNNGTEFLFEGLHSNISQIKSLHGITDVWVEEAETVEANSWSTLGPTIRTPGSQIYVTFNPREEEDATSVMFAGQRNDSVILTVNWQMNPFFPEILRKDKDREYKTNPDLAAHVWGGEYRRNSDAQIFANKVRLELFEPQNDWDGPWYGLDFGFSRDPLSCHEYWGKGNTLYVRREAWGIGVELNDIPSVLRDGNSVSRGIPRLKKIRHTIRADNSRPETISHLRSLGLDVVAADKWPGSVEDGISYLRSLDAIVIHPEDCPNASREARYYSYKVDRNTGKVTNKVIDAHNHFWDDCRYALQPAIMTPEETHQVVHEEPISRQGICHDLDEIDGFYTEPGFGAI